MKRTIVAFALMCLPINAELVPWEVPAAIVADLALPAFIVPVAANAAGGAGTFFRTDLTLANFRAVEQRRFSPRHSWLSHNQVIAFNPRLYATGKPAYVAKVSPSFEAVQKGFNRHAFYNLMITKREHPGV